MVLLPPPPDRGGALGPPEWALSLFSLIPYDSPVFTFKIAPIVDAQGEQRAKLPTCQIAIAPSKKGASQFLCFF